MPTMGAKHIPPDKINLKLILVSGKTHEFLFSPSDSVSTITAFVYDNWPAEWADESLPPTNILRLIYQGRFLHGNVTLGALQLSVASTVVMHLVMREQLPEPTNQGQQKDKSRDERCCNCCCTVCWSCLERMSHTYSLLLLSSCVCLSSVHSFIVWRRLGMHCSKTAVILLSCRHVDNSIFVMKLQHSVALQ